MFNENQFRVQVVIPALKSIDLYSPEAAEIIIATIAQESRGGTYLSQIGGRAEGVIQMERDTYEDIWKNYLKPKHFVSKSENSGPSLLEKIMESCNLKEEPKFEELTYNLRLNVIMCRVHYLRFPDSLPNINNLDDIWLFYKKRYNTPLGKATKSQFLANYRLFTGKVRRNSI